MQILLANAKIMFEKADRKPISVPLFQSVANDLAKEMAMMNVEELAKQLDCSSKIAMTNWKRYHNFMAAEKMPAILAYNGQAYKHLRASSLSEDSLEYAQKHLWITCFLYGLTVGWHRTLSYGALRIARSYKRQAYQSVLERQTDRCSHR